MNATEIIRAIRPFRTQNSFWAEVYEYLMSGTEEAEDTLDTLVSENFKDALDIIMYIEENGLV